MGNIDEHVIDVRDRFLRTLPAIALNHLFHASQIVRKAWIAGCAPKQRHAFSHTQISLIMPAAEVDYPVGTERSVHSLLKQTDSNWQLCLPRGSSSCDDQRVCFVERMSGATGTLNELLAAATGDWIGFLAPGDELRPDALAEVIRHAGKNRDTDFIYSDELMLDERGAMTSHFLKPDWSPSLLLSMNYLRGLVLIRRDLVERAGPFREEAHGALYYDLLLRATEQAGRIVHLAKPVYHRYTEPDVETPEAGVRVLRDALRRRGIGAHVFPIAGGSKEQAYRIQHDLPSSPHVSIIIPTRNNAAVLRRCIESIESLTTYPSYEIIIVDHDSDEAETKNYLAGLPHKIIPHTGRFNYSLINNQAAKVARGDLLVFLNNDTRVISPDWLQSLAEHVLQPGVGIAGAKLLYADGTVQHAGTIVGYHECASNYSRMQRDEPGYHGFANVARECSAVTGACMMMRKDLFNKIGGFDERMDRAWQDVDLCLRASGLGYRVIFTPFALLYHDEGHTRGRFDSTPEESASKLRFQSVNRRYLKRGDPYYNRNFSPFYDYFTYRPRERRQIAVDTPSLVARFLRDGHAPEGPDLRWVGPKCMLFVFTRSSRSQTFSFALTSGQADYYGRMPLRVVLRVNGKAASEFAIGSPDERHYVQLRFPAGRTVHIVEILCSDSFSPHAIGLNSDRRNLSLMFTNADVNADVIQDTLTCRLRTIHGFYHRDPSKWASPHVELEAECADAKPHVLHANFRRHSPDVYNVFPFRVRVAVDDREIASFQFTATSEVADVDVPIVAPDGLARVQFTTTSFFVPQILWHSGDPRELSYAIEHIELLPFTPTPNPTLAAAAQARA